jgi:hypothetical protein
MVVFPLVPVIPTTSNDLDGKSKTAPPRRRERPQWTERGPRESRHRHRPFRHDRHRPGPRRVRHAIVPIVMNPFQRDKKGSRFHLSGIHSDPGNGNRAEDLAPPSLPPTIDDLKRLFHGAQFVSCARRLYRFFIRQAWRFVRGNAQERKRLPGDVLKHRPRVVAPPGHPFGLIDDHHDREARVRRGNESAKRGHVFVGGIAAGAGINFLRGSGFSRRAPSGDGGVHARPPFHHPFHHAGQRGGGFRRDDPPHLAGNWPARSFPRGPIGVQTETGFERVVPRWRWRCRPRPIEARSRPPPGRTK